MMDSIRPYNEQEAIEAFKRIARDPFLAKVSEFLFPNSSYEAFAEKISSLHSIGEFQSTVMADVVESIIKQTSSSLTFSGLENVLETGTHLFLSNHRDIILDPAIVQFLLVRNGCPTTEIAVGNNLISSSFSADVMRSNRMITVKRDGSPRDIYNNSAILSQYIRTSILSHRCSIWIAQREGRTKDGMDRTGQGLLKMLQMSGTKDFAADFFALSIIPISISYQFEPCDFYKARELYISKRRKYVKAPGEDTRSILTGVSQNKGKIHINFGDQLTASSLDYCASFDKNERYQTLASHIDQKIVSSYKLWDNNYIAWDILNHSNKYSTKYSLSEKNRFVSYMEKGISSIVKQDNSIDINELRDIFLSIYSNPIS